VHINGYVVRDGQISLWVAKRAATKQTWPSLLDHIVAGGQARKHACKTFACRHHIWAAFTTNNEFAGLLTHFAPYVLMGAHATLCSRPASPAWTTSSRSARRRPASLRRWQRLRGQWEWSAMQVTAAALAMPAWMGMCEARYCDDLLYEHRLCALCCVMHVL